MTTTARNCLSLVLVIALVMSSGLQAARATLDTPSPVGIEHLTGSQMHHGGTGRHKAQHHHGAASPGECLVACLDALPDKFLAGHEARSASRTGPVDHDISVAIVSAWPNATKLQSRRLSARGPPFEAQALGASVGQATWLRTHRIRI